MPTPSQSKNTPVSMSSTADIIAAVAGQSVYVYGGMLVGSAGVTLDIQDGTTSLAGVMSIIAGTPLYLHPYPDGQYLFKTAAGAALHAVQFGAGQISGYLRTFQG